MTGRGTRLAIRGHESGSRFKSLLAPDHLAACCAELYIYRSFWTGEIREWRQSPGPARRATVTVTAIAEANLKAAAAAAAAAAVAAAGQAQGRRPAAVTVNNDHHDNGAARPRGHRRDSPGPGRRGPGRRRVARIITQ